MVSEPAHDHGPRTHAARDGDELTFAALKVGQRVGVTGERRRDGTLVAQRVHLPKP